MALRPTIEQKLILLKDRFAEIRALLSDVKVINDQQRFKELSKEYAYLTPIVASFDEYQATQVALKEAGTMLEDADAELKTLAMDEIKNLNEKINQQEEQLQILLLPVDPNDTANVFLEIRAAAGGDEAAIFAGD